MAAKAKKEEVKKVLFGRPGSSLKIGIVGLPNVGKSTLFNLLSKLNVPAENYPFCTIEPNVSRVEVPDERFDWLVKHFKPAKDVRAILTVTDIAGLVKGAHLGEGLGNSFLSHIRAVDGIYHVCRLFEDSEVTHVDGSVDPIRDIATIHDELRLKDIEQLQQHLSKLEKIANHVDKTKKVEFELGKRVLALLEEGKSIRLLPWKATEIEIINEWLLLTTKPLIYLVNLSEEDFIKKKNKWLVPLMKWIQENGNDTIIPFSAAFEKKLSEKTPEEVEAYCTEKKVKSVLSKIIREGYHTLELCHFFTVGEDEVKCWTVRKGTLAPQAAGTIHTDFEQGFIKAEVQKYVDFKELGSESAVRAAGKFRTEGKNYVVEDGDMIFFKFNAPSSSKKK